MLNASVLTRGFQVADLLTLLCARYSVKLNNINKKGQNVEVEVQSVWTLLQVKTSMHTGETDSGGL